MIGLFELERVNGERHVFLVGAAARLVRRVSAVHYGSEDGGDGWNVRRLVAGQQPRQPHELAVPVEHLARSLALPFLRSLLAVPSSHLSHHISPHPLLFLHTSKLNIQINRIKIK